MAGISVRDAVLRVATKRAAAQARPTGTPAAPGLPPIRMGVALSAMMKHGGLYTLADGGMMESRINALLSAVMAHPGMTPDRAVQHLQKMASRSAAIPTYFFYHICDRPYRLHSRLISHLTYPQRHLRGPADHADPDDAPTTSPGRTFSTSNTPSTDIPAAFTFVGQFIDHDLTLNALNLFDDQTASGVNSEASPFLDLDSVYGIRADDPPQAGHAREIPMEDGYFRLRRIRKNGYDVCREDKDAFGQHCAALIGDKRNDENQIILQIHILLMRLHNAFRGQGRSKKAAQTQTILHWQAFVLHQYLPKVCDPAVVTAVLARLRAGQPLVHRPGRTICGGCTLGMPHEFAIGFRFGHSQLRSAYVLNANPPFRLFDSLSNGKDDLQGGKCLDENRLIDWPAFLARNTVGEPVHPSNLIDRKVNQVVFDLPESAIPDDIKFVSNLPFRNLVRSDSVGLCAGEDLARTYNRVYGAAVTPLTFEEVEPDKCAQPLFHIGDHPDEFRTPLWYYLLREAEVRRPPDGPGHLGPLGSHLVAEVILSAIWYASVSLLNPKHDETLDPVPEFPNAEAIDLVSIAAFVEDHDTSPHGCIDADPCERCSAGNPAICGGAEAAETEKAAWPDLEE